jgi:hypothetical protein
MLGLSSPGLAQQSDSIVDVTVRVPGTIPGLQVRLVVNGALARFRFPGSGEVTLPFTLDRMGSVRLELNLPRRRVPSTSWCRVAGRDERRSPPEWPPGGHGKSSGVTPTGPRLASPAWRRALIRPMD